MIQQTVSMKGTSLDMAVIDIQRALEGQMYYIALICTLSLIDICSALETPTGETDRDKFIKWYDTHLGPYYIWLSGQDCYGIRCGMIHQGVMRTTVKGKSPSRWSRVGFIFSAPGDEMREIATDDFYCTGLAEFCTDVIARVRAWWGMAKNDPTVQKNAQNLMRLHPDGLPLVMKGAPILS